MHTTILRSIALVSLTLAAAPLPAQVESITVDAAAPTQPFPHFWERMFGSGRAVLSLRESYREDLRAVRAVTAVAYVRFHAILHDEVGVYSEDSKGEPVYNFSYIDQIYDGLLANGVRPLVELVSTHVYGDDTAQDIFGTHERIPRERMVCRAVQKVHTEIQASARPSLPLIWTEFNASFANHPEITDAPYMGPWLAETIRQCDGLVQDMSYWTFSDVFEEQGVVKTPFYGGFGLLAAGGIPKPAFNAFALLHQLGEQRFGSAAEGALLTRRADGALVVALWNYADVGATSPIRKVTLTVKNFDARTASVQSLDDEHGNVHKAYEKMGSPRYPTQGQVAELRAAAALPAPESHALRNGTLDVAIPSQGLILVTILAKR